MEPEIEAMGTVAEALADLEDEARARVLRWAIERYGVEVSVGGRVGKVAPPHTNGGPGASSPRAAPPAEPGFQDFVDLFDAIDPKNDADKALVGAYWLQVVEGSPSWQAQSVNSLLKNTGHGVGNITTALRSLQNRKPALVRQMTKSGRSRQARKTYKLTSAGLSHVRQQLGLSAAVPAALMEDSEDDGS